MMRALLVNAGGGAGGWVVNVALEPMPVVTLKPTPAGRVTLIVPCAFALAIPASEANATKRRRITKLLDPRTSKT
jgi:hypothetical protein